MGNRLFDNYFKYTIFILVLLLLIFNERLGIVYSLMMVASWFWYRTDKNHFYKLARPENSLSKILMQAAIAYGIFLFLTTVLVQTVAPSTLSTINLQSIFQLLSTSTPILQGSKILTVIGWGILIPIIETVLFFVIAQEGFAESIGRITGKKINLGEFSPRMIWTVLLIASAFVLFHLTAKQMEIIPLMITGVFAIISGLLVIKQKEARGAIALHIISNTLVVLASVGWL